MSARLLDETERAPGSNRLLRDAIRARSKLLAPSKENKNVTERNAGEKSRSTSSQEKWKACSRSSENRVQENGRQEVNERKENVHAARQLKTEPD